MFVRFYRTGDELFRVMCGLEKALDVKSFFVMDENFLIDKKRALRLLEKMEEHDKPWSMYVFSSVNVLRQYTIEQLVGLGVSWVWMGLEGKEAPYKKLADMNTVEFVKRLREHGIRVLGSSIIGLEEHTPENIDEVIDYAVSHQTEFHQFMLYTPIPGTPLFEEHEANHSIKGIAEVSVADIHGQHIFNFRHPHIRDGQETEFLLRAFRRDFEVNGPSIVRIVRTTLRAWKKYKNHPDSRIRARFAYEAANLPVRYAGVLWATRRYFRGDPRREAQADRVLNELYEEFGLRSRLSAPFVGRYLYRSLKRQERLLDKGWTYEPPVFFETNFSDGPAAATRIQCISPNPESREASPSQDEKPAASKLEPVG